MQWTASCFRISISRQIFIYAPCSTRSLCSPNSLLITPRIDPTRTAATTVPAPTEPSLCRISRHAHREIATMEISKQTFILLKRTCVLSEMAFMAPSPASGMISAGRYRKMPNAMTTVLQSIMARRISRFSGVGKKENK